MNLKQIKSNAADKIETLDNPESIRTPGRTWTKYPETAMKTEEYNPEVTVEGEADIHHGEDAVEAAGDRLFDALNAEEDKLTALHAANLNAITYIKVEESAEIDILYEGGDTAAHVVVELEDGAELRLTENFRNNGVLTSFNEFYVGENASMTYGAIEASESELTYSRRKAVLEDYAKMTWLNTQFRGELKRTKIDTVMKGDSSEVDKLALWYPTGKQHNDISMHAYHRGKNTRCQMSSRAVVDDEARSVYEGMQHVADQADDTSSFQDEKVLTLSDKAEVDASPKLMIEDPNVEASHAASAGNLPEGEIHYMESRGLSEKDASNLIVKGFFEPVMQDIKLPEFKKKVREEIKRKLSR